MKNLLTLFLVFICSVNGFASTTTIKFYTGPKVNGVCTNQTGMCMIKTTNLTVQDNGILGTLKLSDDQTTVTLSFTTDQLALLSSDIVTQLQNGTFSQPQVYIFTQDVFSQIGYIGSALQIPIGNYTATQTASGYSIVFNVIGS